MGQESSTYSLDRGIKPGTYRIVHAKTSKALQIRDENKQKLVIWDRQNLQHSDEPTMGNDHWYIRHSGDGYLFEHCQNGTYISIALGPADPYHVCATKYPTTWVVYSNDGDSSECLLAIDSTRSKVMSVDSGFNSSGQNGDTICLSMVWADSDKRWRLERIGDATGADDAAEKINHLTLQLNMAQTETNERNSALIRAQEKLGKKEAELTVKEEELVQKNVELLEAENKLKAKDEDLIGKEDQLAHMGDQLTSREGELARAQKVIEEKDAEIVKLIEQLAANEREMKRRYEELWVEHRIKLEKDRELSNREGAAEKIQTDNAVNHMLEKQPIAAPTQKTNNDNTHGVTWSKRAGEQSVISGGGSRAITTSRSTGLDVKLAGLGWDFDDS